MKRRWIPAFAGMTLTLSAAAADGLLQNRKVDFLPVDEAFQLQALDVRDGALEVSWRIADEYYLYRHRLKFTLTAPPGVRLGAAQLPRSEKHHDEHFGTVEIFRGDVVAKLPLSGAGKGPYKLTVVYQGCADAGLCYPPQTRTLEAAR